MKVLTKQQLMAIDNMAILMQAKNDGLQIEQEDLLVNYAEIDHTLSDLETSWGERASERMLTQFMKWLRKVEKPEDLDFKKMDLMMQPLLMEFVRDVWDYGQQTAEDEVSVIEAQSFAEATGGKARKGNLTNEDAFEWYQKYMKELARSGQEAAFIYMQPLILEKLESGTVRMELAQSLEEDFKRFGQVRTQIIARTESNKAFNWGRRYRFDKSPAIAGYRYSSILDERTTEICNYLHGHSWAIGDPGLDENTPPNHYQCRGLIVAINKYRSFTFDPPEAGWEDGLPDKERKVYEKFKDSTYYPKADTVVTLTAPKMDPPKKVAIPKPAAPAPVQSGSINAADIQSVADIKAWGDQRQIAINLDSIPFDTVKDIIGRTEKTLDKIPLLQEYLKNYKDTAQMTKFSGEYAHALKGGISFNPLFWKDVEKKKKAHANDVSVQHSPQNVDHLSTVTHELGHVFEYMMMMEGYKGETYTKPFYASVIRKAALKATKTKVMDIGKNLSRYAVTSDREFFAEAFSEWLDSPSPRPLAMAVGVEVMRVIAEITAAKEAANK